VTHLEKFIALYKEFGVELTPEETDTGTEITLGADSYERERVAALDGYFGFFTKVIFDKQGNFVSQGFWE